MSHVEELNIDELEEMAVHFVPAFRDKFDFSDPKHYEGVAHHAFEQAKAVRKMADELLTEARKKDLEEAEKKRKSEVGGVN